MEPMTSLPFGAHEAFRLAPIVVPALFGLVALLADLFMGRGASRTKTPLAIISVSGAALAAIGAISLWRGDVDQVQVAGSVAFSAFSAALAVAILLGSVIMAMAGAHHDQGPDGAVRPTTHAHGEFFGLLLFATSGMLALVVANDLVTFFVALETLSIAVYAMTGLDRRRARSAEGAMKYFVLGAFSSGFLLYGMSLLYGATGTLRLSDMAALREVSQHSHLATTGAVLVLVGLLFKVAAVPFHAWSPDAYEGAPSAVTGFMSVGVKVAAFAGSMRLVAALGESHILGGGGAWALWVIAALTIIGGNAGALTQRNPRRLLAYSSIAHTGYVLIGLIALARSFDPEHPSSGPVMVDAGKDAVAGVLFYLLAYAAANATAFAVLAHLERDGKDIEDVGELAGLAKAQPGVAAAMTIALVSLAGIPATGGFLGKLWVFRAGIAAGDVGLVVLALVTSALSLYYYLSLVVAMYMREPGQPGPDGSPTPLRDVSNDPRRWCSRLAIGVGAVVVLVLGLYPGQTLLRLVSAGAEALR